MLHVKKDGKHHNPTNDTDMNEMIVQQHFRRVATFLVDQGELHIAQNASQYKNRRDI